MVTISAFQIKMLAEDPSSILGGSTGTWENPGPHFFFYVNRLVFSVKTLIYKTPRALFITSFFDDADDRRDEQDLLL